jgi:MFS family permease
MTLGLADRARADRAEAVRRAARSWRRAGAIDDAALAAIEARYPDDRVRVGPVFRVLLFLFTLIAGNAGFGMVSVLVTSASRSGNDAGFLAFLSLLAGGAFAALTEVQIGKLRRRQGGTEAATSFMAVGFLIGAVAWWVFWPSTLNFRNVLPGLCITAALLAAAAWRWGYPLYAGAATATLLAALACLPLGRLWWIVLPLAAAPLLFKLSASPRLPPAHRHSWIAVLLVSLAGLYAAVHLGSWQAQIIEDVGHLTLLPSAPQGDTRWSLSVAATALVPILLLAFGLRGRRYPLILLGAGTAVVSLVTLRWYIHVAPLWVVLTLSGVMLAAVVLVLRRYLESGPDGERHGYTAAPLFQDAARQRLFEAGAAILTMTPAARELHEEPKFEGGGGQFGGGGASGEY